MSVPAAVITCSDSAARGVASDTSGPLAAELLAGLGHDVAGVDVVADEVAAITTAVHEAIAAGARVVVTTGGTGAGPRDVTPEALRSMGLRELPGLGEAIRAASRSTVPAADLSRALGGILDGAVVLALPGSPGGVRDGLAAVGLLLEHAAEMAAGGAHPGQRRASADPATPAVDSVDPTDGIGDRSPAGDLVGPEPISEAVLAQQVRRAAAGAVVTFAGIVRDHDQGRTVSALHYEGHPDAARVMAEVLAEALVRPGVLAAAARHRVGDLEVGDVAFVAAVSAAHRREAFAACAWLVDEAKARLPIWKHQRFTDGTDEWVNSP
ncbi:MAG TPA: molybdenum cofactor biosynthesis protein MoaE [Motilibacterales bacterium]|nr:molybdenum cofactor biosynthesis protein MoaE [Motilibacterales bacterium]